MVVNERPTKRMKRRISADLYNFLKFPDADDLRCDESDAGDPFRKTVQRFLTNHARLIFPPSLFPSLMTWQILFRIGELVDGSDLSTAMVTLDIVEEDVTRSRSSVYCDQCRVVGWSGHPVCRKRYHFIIRAASNNMEAYQRPCSRCGNTLQLSEPRCKWCNNVITADDLEDWVYAQIEDNTHLLHGIVHSNGYGHLLTLNGREGGSKLLSGSHIMGFWDRLCVALAVRKVSVMDLSKKLGVEYRLLHAITNGSSWYGNWGYEFGTGSYALTQELYQNAVNTLSSMPLKNFMFQDRRAWNRLQCVISLYQSLADTELVTIRDLFSFLVTLIGNFRKPLSTARSSPGTCNVLCPWTRNDVEAVQEALIRVMQASAASSGPKWVTRRALKGALCRGVASPELLDYSLKHLGGKLTSSLMVVRSRCNTTTSAVEFRLEALNVIDNEVHASANPSFPSEEQVVSDLNFLFDSIIHPDRMLSYRPSTMRGRVADAARKLLDCKQFMKDYNQSDKMVSSVIRMWCHVELSDQPKDDPTPPPELIVLPLNATVADLKREAANAFQEVYAMYKRFQVEEILEYGSIYDSLSVKFLLGTNGSVRILGKCPAKHGLNRFKMERGTESWKVDCTCGAKDDDGERMLACDKCGVWQHTRCAGIRNSDAIPSKFECVRCVNLFSNKEPKKLPDSFHESKITNLFSKKEAQKLSVSFDESKNSPKPSTNLFSNKEPEKFPDSFHEPKNSPCKPSTNLISNKEPEKLPDSFHESKNSPCKPNTTCRDEVVAADSPAVACNMTLDFSVR